MTGYRPLPEDATGATPTTPAPHESATQPGWTARFDRHDDEDDDDTNNCRMSLSEERAAVVNRDTALDTVAPRAGPASPGGHAHSGTRYTALRPTSVQELELDPDLDPALSDAASDDLDLYESGVRLNLVHNGPRQARRVKIALWVCVSTGIALLLLGCVFLFLLGPLHRGRVVSPGGSTPTAELLKLKHLGDNVAVTSCGLVRGTYEHGAHVFRGIPYAAPPTGSLRWKKPVPLSYDAGTCWHGVVNTTSFANVCLQPLLPSPGDDVEWSLQGREDCLYLNVWTASLNPPQLRPVLVWLHSGDFLHGSGHARGMSPTPDLAASTDAVYVSFNFRLGVFGFLALDALREKGKTRFGTAGNYGIMDQQLALKWVKENIRNFGGDSNRITVFGHGSGATSIQALLLSPASSGLFSRAWLSSPVALLNKTLAQACEDNRSLMTRSGCSNTRCLRGLDARTLVKLSPWPLDPRWTLGQLINSPSHTQRRNGLAIFDGHVEHWNYMKHGPTGPAVPVVIGTTYSDLGGLKTDLSLTNMTWDELDAVLVDQLSPVGTEAVLQIKTRYSQQPRAGHSAWTSPEPTSGGLLPLPCRQMARLVRDIETVCPAKLLADTFDALYAQAAPVYLYVSEAFPSRELCPPDRPPTDACFAGYDMVAFFDSFQEFGFRGRQADISFRGIMRQELLSLARSGKPNASRWRTEGVNTGILRSEVTVTPAPASYFDNCDTLRQFGFFRYSWTNENSV